MKHLLMCAIIVATSSVAQAQSVTVFQTGFEPTDGYSPGNLNGQNGWQSWLGEDPNFGEIVTAGALNGSQSAFLDGADVQLGSFGNYAAAQQFVSIAPSMGGASLRYIQLTARCAILDPTVNAAHHSNFWITHYDVNEESIGGVGAGSRFGQYVFGFPVNNAPNPMVPVSPGVAFEFRHVLDYQTETASAWKDGQVAFLHLNRGFDNGRLPPNEFDLELLSIDNLPFDTRVWIDDIHIKAVYGCEADTNADLEINVDDLVAVILAWGPCPLPPTTCPADVDGDDDVDVDDLVAVILGWGSCS
jgi:hypothetical protein